MNKNNEKIMRTLFSSHPIISIVLKFWYLFASICFYVPVFKFCICISIEQRKLINNTHNNSVITVLCFSCLFLCFFYKQDLMTTVTISTWIEKVLDNLRLLLIP